MYIQQDATLHSLLPSNTSTIAAGSSDSVTNTRCCRYNSFIDINL